MTAVTAAGAESTNVAAAAPREQRLEPERARAGEEVEHPRVLHESPRIENSASRTRSEVGRVATPLGRGEAPAAPAAGDDPHFRRSVAVMPAWSDG